jgi:hypothetical protein
MPGTRCAIPFTSSSRRRERIWWPTIYLTVQGAKLIYDVIIYLFMKTFRISAASLLAGIAIGWYIQNGRARNESAEIVDQMLQTIQSSEYAEVARDVRAIGLIESGDTQGVMHLLSRPIANYYWLYTVRGGTDERRSLRLRSAIESLAATNQIVAIELTNAKVNVESGGENH